MAGQYLDDAVERVPVVDHEGKSGALLERVTLADGRHLTVKRFSPATDLLMAVLGDVVGREYVLWSRGILDLLPPEVGHAVVDGWVDGDETVIVMRDLGDSVLTWQDRLTRDQCRSMLISVAAQHRAFLGTAPEDLTPLPDLLADPQPLADALRSRPTTLVHGDLATVNMAFCDGELTLLDWATAYDETAMRLSLFSALCWLGWNKALDAVEHPDPVVLAREQQDLDWWLQQARLTLDAVLL